MLGWPGKEPKGHRKNISSARICFVGELMLSKCNIGGRHFDSQLL